MIDMFSESGHLHSGVRILDCRYRQDTGDTVATWDNAQVRSTISVGKEESGPDYNLECGVTVPM